MLLLALMVVVLSILLASSPKASAGQKLNPRGDETLSATISRSEATLIRIEGQQIRRIFGTEGEFSITADQETGSAYITPITKKQAITVYVADHGGNTYKMMFAITNGPVDPIVIKALTPKKNKAVSPDLPRTQSIKRMIVALEADDSLGFEATKMNRVVPLWAESMFVLQKVIDSGTLKGERYLLTNMSMSKMVVDEREFYRRRVMAVSITKPVLMPGESTDVDIILESQDE